jgi:hypothetical protein
MSYFRFVVGGVGIYEAVERDCLRNDPRRLNKPDGSWLPKKGLYYPGAVSFWTNFGLKKYFDSGLLEWHISVVKGNAEVVIIDQPKEILYEDEYQIIFDKNLAKVKNQLSLSEFLEKIRTNKL